MEEDSNVFAFIDDVTTEPHDGIGSGQQQDEQSSTLCILSINDAQMGMRNPQVASLVSAHRHHMKVIADYVLEHKDTISGSEADWHNIITKYFDDNDYSTALALSEAGLARFPHDASLLADAIRSAGEVGDWDKGDSWVKNAELPDNRTDESWTLAVYVGAYLCSKAHTQNAASREKTYKQALDCINGAISRLPPNDHLINQKAEILIDSGEEEKARQVLDDAIFCGVSVEASDSVEASEKDGKDKKSVKKRIPVPQCCATYLDKILGDSCEYDKIIQIADVGIRYLKIEQQSVSAYYFYYRKALAMDGQIHSSTIASQASGFGNQDYVRSAMSTYAIAYALGSTGIVRDACRDNFLVLGAMAGISDLKVDAFCSDEEV